jgi:chromosomal replication initiation ATPase DnaA
MLFNAQRQLTFASFKSKPSSMSARSACAQFATRQGIAHGEPLLMLAGCAGSGKTHLLHATANLAKGNDAIRSSSTLSAHRLIDEVQRACFFGDLPFWRTRFASVDWLAIDDVDDLFGQPVASDFLLQVLQLRCDARRRTLLTASLSRMPSADSALTLFLNPHAAVRLI